MTRRLLSSLKSTFMGSGWGCGPGSEASPGFEIEQGDRLEVWPGLLKVPESGRPVGQDNGQPSAVVAEGPAQPRTLIISDPQVDEPGRRVPRLVEVPELGCGPIHCQDGHQPAPVDAEDEFSRPPVTVQHDRLFGGISGLQVPKPCEAASGASGKGDQPTAIAAGLAGYGGRVECNGADRPLMAQCVQGLCVAVGA